MNPSIRGSSLPLLLLSIALGTAGCEPLPLDPMAEEEAQANRASDACPASEGAGRVLVDASHDGGVWWFPQAFPFDPEAPHQGQGLAEHFRECGYTVDELGRGTVVTSSILWGYDIVIRAGKFGAYQEGELEAYEQYVAREATLILLGEFLRDGQTDPVAERLDLHFSGVYRGTVTDFADHPITEGVDSVPYIAGSALLEFDPSRVTVLGRLDGLPVMGLLHGYAAKVFFMGDTNSLETVPQPLVANLMAWGF